MFAEFSLKRNPTGIFTVSSGGESGFLALNSNPLSNTRLSAVEATNDPPIFKRALGPKTIPLGLIKNRLAGPKTPRVPRIFEALPPVTLVKIFVIPPGFVK